MTEISETQNTVKFAFIGGRKLEKQSEDVPLNNMLRPFSEKVLRVLDKTGLVIVDGEAGLGKSEAFLSTELKVEVGGIVNLLKGNNRSYKVINLQQRGVDRKIDEIGNVDVVLFDESGVMIGSKDVLFDLIKNIRDRGIKVVLVGGGTYPVKEQVDLIAQGLEEVGIDVSNEQKLEFPALLLNDQQSVGVLQARYPNISADQAKAVVDKIDSLIIPRIFRVLWLSNNKPEYITPDHREITSRYIEAITK